MERKEMVFFGWDSLYCIREEDVADATTYPDLIPSKENGVFLSATVYTYDTFCYFQYSVQPEGGNLVEYSVIIHPGIIRNFRAVRQPIWSQYSWFTINHVCTIYRKKIFIGLLPCQNGQESGIAGFPATKRGNRRAAVIMSASGGLRQ